jgi:hypothetical protein
MRATIKLTRSKKFYSLIELSSRQEDPNVAQPGGRSQRTGRVATRNRIRSYPSEWANGYVWTATQAEDFPGISPGAFVSDLHNMAQRLTAEAQSRSEQEGFIVRTARSGLPPDVVEFQFHRAPMDECPDPGYKARKREAAREHKRGRTFSANPRDHWSQQERDYFCELMPNHARFKMQGCPNCDPSITGIPEPLPGQPIIRPGTAAEAGDPAAYTIGPPMPTPTYAEAKAAVQQFNQQYPYVQALGQAQLPPEPPLEGEQGTWSHCGATEFHGAHPHSKYDDNGQPRQAHCLGTYPPRPITSTITQGGNPQ